VNFPAPARLTGSLAEVRITAALAHTLRGEVLLREKAA
jgi:tRNA-2-methylthio-N6-dimethylallyladenosine synthase